MIHEIFPTPIMVVDLSDVLDMKDVKKRCMTIIGKLDHHCVHGLVPDGVSSYNGNTPVITDERVSYLKNVIMMNVRKMEQTLGLHPLEFTNSWINIMPKGSTINPHIHPYSVVSGAFYLDAGEGSGEFVIENPLYNQQMAVMTRTNTPYTQVFLDVEVKTGTLILFPSYLKHHVKSNKYEGRTVLSFNTTYDPRFDVRTHIQ